MRRFMSIAFAAVLVPFAHAAQAEPANAQQMSELAGDYQLSDGRRLSIDFDGAEVFVQVDKKPRQQLQGNSEGQFTTYDGSITIRHKLAAESPLEVMLRGRPVTVMR